MLGAEPVADLAGPDRITRPWWGLAGTPRRAPGVFLSVQPSRSRHLGITKPPNRAIHRGFLVSCRDPDPIGVPESVRSVVGAPGQLRPLRPFERLRFIAVSEHERAQQRAHGRNGFTQLKDERVTDRLLIQQEEGVGARRRRTCVVAAPTSDGSPIVRSYVRRSGA